MLLPLLMNLNMFGATITVLNGVSMGKGVTVHSGVSRPNIIDGNVGNPIYQAYDFKPSGVNRETYLINGEIP